jgi:hypothetical protein
VLLDLALLLTDLDRAGARSHQHRRPIRPGHPDHLIDCRAGTCCTFTPLFR